MKSPIKPPFLYIIITVNHFCCMQALSMLHNRMDHVQ